MEDIIKLLKEVGMVDSDNEVRESRGYDHDKKYSDYRRVSPLKDHNIRNLYCSDMDMVEWRNHEPAAITEITRTFGAKTKEEVFTDWCFREKGFQRELAQTMALRAQIPLFVVVIHDENPESQGYSDKTEFLVIQILPDTKNPNHWFDGKRGFRKKYIGKFTKETYITVFLDGLRDRCLEYKVWIGEMR